jgi:hypothetical protein
MLSSTGCSALLNRYRNFTTFEDSKTWPTTSSLQTAMDQFTTNPPLNATQRQGLRYYVNTEVEQEYGASASQISEEWYDEGLNIFGGDFVMPSGRNLSEIAGFLAASLGGSILYNHNVTNIAYNSSGVTVSAP